MSTPTRAAAIAAVMSVLAIGTPVAAASAQTTIVPRPIRGGIHGHPWGPGNAYPGGHRHPGGHRYPGGHRNGYRPDGYAPPHR
jgi:hypothetical protein